MSADGPEQRYLDAREDYERDRDYKDAHEDSFEAWWDRQIDRADFLLDQEKERMFDHFMDKVTRE